MRAVPFWSLVQTKQNREASHATGPRAFRVFFCAARWPRLNGSERFRTVPNGFFQGQEQCVQGLWNFNRWQECVRFICLFPRNPWQKPSSWNLQAVRLLCEQECKVVMCQVAQSSHASPGILQEITICARICHFEVSDRRYIPLHPLRLLVQNQVCNMFQHTKHGMPEISQAFVFVSCLQDDRWRQLMTIRNAPKHSNS